MVRVPTLPTISVAVTANAKVISEVQLTKLAVAICPAKVGVFVAVALIDEYRKMWFKANF